MNEEQQEEVLDFFRTVGEPFQRNYIKQFIQKVPHAKIVEIPNGHHYCFIKQEELVFTKCVSFYWIVRKSYNNAATNWIAVALLKKLAEDKVILIPFQLPKYCLSSMTLPE